MILSECQVLRLQLDSQQARIENAHKELVENEEILHSCRAEKEKLCEDLKKFRVQYRKLTQEYDAKISELENLKRDVESLELHVTRYIICR